MAGAQQDVNDNQACLIAELTQWGREPAEETNRELAPIEKLPAELIGHIFILSASKFGIVALPFLKKSIPPQISFSHVSSTWRGIALSTHELWNNVHISNWKNCHDEAVMALYRQWISRAGNAPITLKLSAPKIIFRHEAKDTASVFYALFQLFQPRKLVLSLCCLRLSSLIDLPADLHEMPHLEELDLVVWGPMTDVKRVPLFIGKTRSISVCRAHIFDMERVALPWSQLRCLKCTKPSMSISDCTKILRHALLLEDCCLTVTIIDSPDSPDKIVMPNLRKFLVDFSYSHTYGFPMDQLICLLVLPNLSQLNILGHAFWTNESYDTLLRQFNFRQLRDVCLSLEDGYFLPLNGMLVDAPFLRTLFLSEATIMDEEAINGLATGRLGKTLKTLYICCDAAEVNGLLNMVEMRQKSVQKMDVTGRR